LTISRLIMGGNLIGGYAHSRDLLYVSRLLRAYNTESKIFETLALAERSGITMIQLNPGCLDFVERYRKERGGKIQVMVCVDVDPTAASEVRDQVQELVGRGAQALYSHGERTDRCVMNCIGGLTHSRCEIDTLDASSLSVSARSRHPAGVNTLLADGKVRFVKSSINLASWRAIGSRNGREVVSAGDY
jgi:Protein of unknown function (DUF1559)